MALSDHPRRASQPTPNCIDFDCRRRADKPLLDNDFRSTTNAANDYPNERRLPFRTIYSLTRNFTAII
jgi:hypothetical protein